MDVDFGDHKTISRFLSKKAFIQNHTRHLCQLIECICDIVQFTILKYELAYINQVQAIYSIFHLHDKFSQFLILIRMTTVKRRRGDLLTSALLGSFFKWRPNVCRRTPFAVLAYLSDVLYISTFLTAAQRASCIHLPRIWCFINFVIF